MCTIAAAAGMLVVLRGGNDRAQRTVVYRENRIRTSHLHILLLRERHTLVSASYAGGRPPSA